jgi:hypothetical protein
VQDTTRFTPSRPRSRTPAAARSRTVADTIGSDFDTVLVAFEQTGSGIEGLNEVDCSDDDFSSQSVVTFTASANTTYYFMAGSCCSRTGVDGGHLVFNVDSE